MMLRVYGQPLSLNTRKELLPKATRKLPKRLPKRLPKKPYAIQNLTEQQQAILSFLKEHPEATRKEISESLSGITEDGVKYNLSRLQELGLLKRIGGRK